MIRRPLILAAAAALQSTITEARVFEVEADVTARYGAPVKVGVSAGLKDKVLIYRWRRMRVQAAFMDGMCQSEDYSNEDGSAFTNAEITSLLTKYSPANTWKLLPPDEGEDAKSWYTGYDEYHLFAESWKVNGVPTLCITTMKYFHYVYRAVERKRGARQGSDPGERNGGHHPPD